MHCCGAMTVTSDALSSLCRRYANAVTVYVELAKLAGSYVGYERWRMHKWMYFVAVTSVCCVACAWESYM